MPETSNTFPFFIAAAILALSGVYFYAIDLEKGTIVMECAAIGFLALGLALRRHWRSSK